MTYVVIFGAGLFSYIFGSLVYYFITSTPLLPFSIQLKMFSEVDYFAVYITELVIETVACIVFIFLYMFSLSIFILVANYIIGQFNLITHLIGQLDVTDDKQLARNLKDIAELHLNVLR